MEEILKIEDLLELFGTPEKYDPKISIKGVSVDSRDELRGRIFFAIKGTKTDGHLFLEEALSKGAVAAFIQNAAFLNIRSGKNIFIVKDTVSALGKLSAFYLKKIEKGKKKIAITGSAGKTTTRHIITNILSHYGKTFSPQRNFNTEIGVPLSIFSIPKDAQFLVFEFGADRPGDIFHLSNLVKPDIGIITNIGPAHIERFGSIEEVGNTKWALAEAVIDKELLIYNEDDPILRKKARMYEGRKIGFGTEEGALVKFVSRQPFPLGENFTVFLGGKLLESEIRLYGLANIYNALSGISLAFYLFDEVEPLRELLSLIPPLSQRLRGIKKKNVFIIDDTYNSNPLSLKNSLDVLSRFEGRRVAVLGDMLELGDLSKVYHREAGREIATSQCADLLVGIGRETEFLVDGARDYGFKEAYFFKDKEDAVEFLITQAKPYDTYLFKGSRGMKMENVMNTFMERLDD